jgi:hypothetical protein
MWNTSVTDEECSDNLLWTEFAVPYKTRGSYKTKLLLAPKSGAIPRWAHHISLRLVIRVGTAILPRDRHISLQPSEQIYDIFSSKCCNLITYVPSHVTSTMCLYFTQIKLFLCLTNEALRHENVWGSGCIDPSFLDLGTSWRWVARVTPLSFYPGEKAPH